MIRANYSLSAGLEAGVAPNGQVADVALSLPGVIYFLNVLFIFREIEHEWVVAERERERQREREKERGSEAGSRPQAVSPMKGSNSRAMRS